MKKFLSVSLLLVALVLLTAACGGSSADDLLGDIEERGTIRVSTDANYAPQSYLDANGDFIGFDIDVATEIAERLGGVVEVVTPDCGVSTAGGWGGQWAMSVCPVGGARSSVEYPIMSGGRSLTRSHSLAGDVMASASSECSK